jgi:hypothetical protein
LIERFKMADISIGNPNSTTGAPEGENVSDFIQI